MYLGFARSILRIACAIVAVMLLASCGIAEAPPQTSVAPPVPQKAADNKPESLEASTITMLIPQSYKDMQILLDSRAEQLNLLLSMRGIPAKLELKSAWGYDIPDLSRQMTGDIAIVSPESNGGIYKALALQGKLADLTDEIESRPEFYAINPEWIWDLAQVDGSIYGFPLYTMGTGVSQSAPQSGMLIRDDVLAALDAQKPKTLDELINLGKRANESGLDCKISYLNTYPPYPLHREYDDWPFYVDKKSLFIFDIDGNVAPYPGSDVYWKDVEAFDRLSKEGLLQGYDDIRMASNKMSANKWNSFAIFYVNARPGNGSPHYEDFSFAQFSPESANYDSYTGFFQVLVVNGESPNAALALDIIEAIYTDQDVYDALMYGVEGVDWEVQEEGDYKPINSMPWVFQFTHSSRARNRADSKLEPWFQEVPEETMIDMPAVRFEVTDQSLVNAVVFGAAYTNYNNYVKLRMHGAKRETLDNAVNTMLEDPSYQQLLELTQKEYAEFLKKYK